MAIISPLTYTIANGQAVDATPVMADLNQIVGNVNANAAGLSQSNTFASGAVFQSTVQVDGQLSAVSGISASGAVNLTSATTTVSASVSGTAQAVPRNQADTTYRGPSFSAYQSTPSSLTNNVFTKVAFQTKEWDTNNAFDNTTNYRFQPAQAGYYQTNLSVSSSSAGASGYFQVAIFKNGAVYKSSPVSTAPGVYITNASCLVFLNGSTDYIEGFANQTTGAAVNTDASASQTYFDAAFVRGA